MKLSSLCTTYLKLIERTCAIRFHGVENLPDNFIVGFWHQDSMIMNLALRIMARQGMPLTIVMTADPRGDTIEEVVRAFDGKAFRLSYSGRTSLTALKSLIEHTLQEKANIATPLDGPLGPLYVPKKFHFLLANKTGLPFLGARVTYSRKLPLTRRWDDYRIPLPFTTIDIYAHNFGLVSEENLRGFEGYRREIQRRLLSPESFEAADKQGRGKRRKNPDPTGQADPGQPMEESRAAIQAELKTTTPPETLLKFNPIVEQPDANPTEADEAPAGNKDFLRADAGASGKAAAQLESGAA